MLLVERRYIYPSFNGEVDNDLGDPLANYLVEHAQEIGIQRVIWDRTYWRLVTNREGGYRAHPHHDHLHVELSVDANSICVFSTRRT